MAIIDAETVNADLVVFKKEVCTKLAVHNMQIEAMKTDVEINKKILRGNGDKGLDEIVRTTADQLETFIARYHEDRIKDAEERDKEAERLRLEKEEKAKEIAKEVERKEAEEEKKTSKIHWWWTEVIRPFLLPLVASGGVGAVIISYLESQ